MGRLRTSIVKSCILYQEDGTPFERVRLEKGMPRYRRFPGSSILWYSTYHPMNARTGGGIAGSTWSILLVLAKSGDTCLVDTGGTSKSNVLYLRDLTEKEAVRRIGRLQSDSNAGMSSSGLRYKLARCRELLGDTVG